MEPHTTSTETLSTPHIASTQISDEPAHMTSEHLDDLRRYVEVLLDPKNLWQADRRDIYCTAVPGAYAQPAYWMLVLNGSPAKSTLVIQWSWSDRYHRLSAPNYILGGDGKARRVPRTQAHLLQEVMNLLHGFDTTSLPVTYKLPPRGAK